MNRLYMTKRFLGTLPKVATIFVVATVAALSFTASAQAWYPERPTYTIANPADHVTFNSITDNPNYGDERTFFDSKDAAITGAGGYADSTKVQNGQEVLLRVYVHNNASETLNDAAHDYKGIARNAKVRVHLPTASAAALRANAYISATNATPGEVSDTADFTSNSAFSMSYVPGSAVAYNNAHPTGMALSDNIVTNGAAIGYENADGNVPGCFQYVNLVTIRVKISAPSLKVEKTVRVAGTKDWKEEVTAKKGETVEYQIRVENTGKSNVDHVVIGDNLPPYMTYVANSTKLKNSNFPNGTNVTSNNVTSGGIEVGSAAPGGVHYVLFQAKVADSFDKGCGVLTLTNVGIAKSDQTGPIEDTAIVKVDSGKVCTTVVKNKTLPKTGAGDVAGIFAGVSALGAVAHNVVSRRRLGRK